nr:ABC transporter ATP-binding protein [Pseudoramibacter sp. HA2172]
MTKLKVEDLGFSIDRTKIIDAISLEVQKNEFIGLVGPNGCGKSTLLKNIYRIYQPDTGKVYLDGDEIQRIKDKAFAKKCR